MNTRNERYEAFLDDLALVVDGDPAALERHADFLVDDDEARDLRHEATKTARELEPLSAGTKVRFAGAVIVRQRPGTARGMLFVTLEDETGMAQAVVTPDLMEENRRLIAESAGLIIEGILERRDGSLSVKAEKFWPIRRLATVPSHDWH